MHSHDYLLSCVLPTIWQLLSGDLLEQEEAGFEPSAEVWKSAALTVSHYTIDQNSNFKYWFIWSAGVDFIKFK